MIINQPSRITFWRFIFAITAIAAIFCVRQVVAKAHQLGVALPASRSWMGLTLALMLLGILSLLLLTLTWSTYRQRIVSFAEFSERLPKQTRPISEFILVLSLIGFTFTFMLPLISLLSGLGWLRFLIFLFFNILGFLALKSIRREIPWFSALVSVALCQSLFHLLIVYWPRVTDYPFAMGWSETSRFYHPSFFFSDLVYGQRYPWPLQNPSLHMLLSIPYLFHAPLWFHRFWQVALRYILVAAVAPVLMKRLSTQGSAVRWMIGIWMVLYLFMGPVYFHLTIPVILVLLGFSYQNDRRTWLVVVLASIWCGWSRVNWYPMPGLIAAVLYLMEVPLKGKSMWRYLFKPALWFIVGTLVAFLSQRVYIAFSGITDTRLFYTSLISDLLWYRLWPNSSFSFGILPGIIWVSLPFWFAIYLVLRAHKEDWHPIRLIFIFAALLIVFIGGIIVSLKIGGGANLHNMDGYFIVLLIFFAYLIFARYRPENEEIAQPMQLHWLLVLALIYHPASTYLQFGIGFKSYDPTRTQNVLTSLQERVDEVDAHGGEILFITQRHLISMGMLHNVTLIPEYEREDLMEMAMSDNEPYLAQFEKDMEDQRFALIVVDPLNYNLLSRNRAFSEENNAWVRRVMKNILCNYRQDAIFPEDEIALYVPQTSARQCP